MRDIGQLQILMREHVFAVWDFMSLLKRMQREVTSVEVPWTPPIDPSAARFINEIVLGEECDEDGRGGYISHFELYLEAMREVGADTWPIETFLRRLHVGDDCDDALAAADVLPTTRAFVELSLKTARTGKPHEVASAFFHGREDIIPEMFSRLVPTVQRQGRTVDRLLHYLKRHIEVDSDAHGPLAERLLARLCGPDEARRTEAVQVACTALHARITLWDGILAAIGASD